MSSTILAAGAVVWRKSEKKKIEVVIIHRPKPLTSPLARAMEFLEVAPRAGPSYCSPRSAHAGFRVSDGTPSNEAKPWQTGAMCWKFPIRMSGNWWETCYDLGQMLRLWRLRTYVVGLSARCMRRWDGMFEPSSCIEIKNRIKK